MKKLKADKIVLRYGQDTPDIIQGLSLLVTPGEFIGVVGPNGSGKSTLVRALSRVLEPSTGTILLDDNDLYRAMSARESARTIATVPQSTSIAFDFTVREVVGMGRTPHRSSSPFVRTDPDDARVVEDSMRSAGILPLANRVASTLSGGEQQRVLLARALAQDPRVLILDEPTSHLDLHHQTQVLRLVQNLVRSRGIAALAVLHDLNLAASYCDRLLMLADGEAVAEGTPAEVLTESNVHRAYGARVWVRCHPVSGRPFIYTLPDHPAMGEHVDARNSTVHVICGAGTGAGILLRLRQLGYHVTAGALNAGDTDQEAAGMLGIPYAREAPFTAFSGPVIAEAEALMRKSNAVVLMDVPFGLGNLPNLRTAALAISEGKPVFALAAADADFADRDFTEGAAGALWSDLIARGMRTAPDIEGLSELLLETLTSEE